MKNNALQSLMNLKSALEDSKKDIEIKVREEKEYLLSLENRISRIEKILSSIVGYELFENSGDKEE